MKELSDVKYVSKNFTMLVPIRKTAYQKLDDTTGKKHWYVQGYASSENIDRDGDRMSTKAVLDMVDQILGSPMTLFVDHEHGFTSGLGVIVKARRTEDGLLWIEARLEDPEINPLTKLLIHKLEIGERIGLSIGGDLADWHDEFDKAAQGTIRVLDAVKLYEISVVGLPANAESFLVGSMFKSLKKMSEDKEVYSLFCKDGQCDMIFKTLKIKSQREELLDMYKEVQQELDRRVLVKEVTRMYEEVLAASGIESPRDTKNYIRIQQYPDEKLSGCSYVTKDTDDGAKLVYCGKTLQTILFPKSKFSLDSAKEWTTSHGYKVGTGELDPGHVTAKEEENDRPPADWFDRCVSSVTASGSADDPEAVCGNLWYNVMEEEQTPTMNTSQYTHGQPTMHPSNLQEEAVPINPMGAGTTATKEKCKGCP